MKKEIIILTTLFFSMFSVLPVAFLTRNAEFGAMQSNGIEV